MSYPPQPNNPYGQQPPMPPQQPYGYPPQPGIPQQGGYAQPGYGYQQPSGMPPYATWGARAAALLLDGLIVNLIPSIILIIGYVSLLSSLTSNCSTDYYGYTSCAPSAPSGGALALIVLGSLLSLAAGLFLVAREGKTGQTPGKKMMGIAVLRERDGQPLGFGMAFVRRLCHGLEFGIGWLWPLWDEKKQTFADKIVSSVVVKR